MITALYSFIALTSLRGLEWWLLIWIGSIGLYVLLFSLFSNNRTKQGRKNLLFCFLASEGITDVLCGIHILRFPALLEFGFGITYGFVIFAVFLALGGFFATVFGGRNTKIKKPSGVTYGIK